MYNHDINKNHPMKVRRGGMVVMMIGKKMKPKWGSFSE